MTQYVFLKLVTGEQIMATMLSDDEHSVTIEFPMQIRMFPTLEETGLIEQITSGPYCQFTEDKIFMFNRKDVLFCKKLHQAVVPHYEKLLDEHERTVEVDEKMLAEGKVESEETVEYLSDAVERLYSIVERTRRMQEEDSSINNLIPGNDTKH